MSATRLGAALLAALALAPAARAQEFLGKPMADWLAGLNDKSSAEVRRGAAFALGKIGLQAAKGMTNEQLQDITEPLLKCFTDADASVREAAVFAIGEILGKARKVNDTTLDRLCQMLAKDTDPMARRSAAYALGSIKKNSPKVTAALAAAAGDAHPAVRQNVAWALGRLGDKSIKSLCKLLKDDDVLVKRDAAGSVQHLSGDVAAEALPDLLKCAAHKDVELRKAALAALVGVVGPDDAEAARGPLLAALKDAQPDVRYNAALAMGQIGGKDALAAIPVFREALRQKARPGLRRSAALAVGGLRAALTAPGGEKAKDDQNHIPELNDALRDKDEELRLNAAMACIRLGPAGQPYVDDLVGILMNKKDPTKVRAQAAVALSRIGFVPGLQKAMPRILELFKDKAEVGLVRERALWPVRLYLKNSGEREPVYAALASILDEQRTQELKMLHYDCAYLLGMFQQKQVPDKVLDTLLAFLKDSDIKLYAGTKGGGGAVGEGKDGGASAKEKGEKDGRVMAVDALSQIGRDRGSARGDIVAQMRALRDDNGIDPALRQRIRDVLKDWGQ